MEKAKRLTPQRRKLAEAYLANGFNGKAAAITAGFSTRRAAATASEILSDPLVRDYIDKRMKELQMSADEALMRMAGHAGGSLSDFIGLTVEEFKQHPKAWLVKEVTMGVEFPDGDRPPYEYIKSIKLHDPQSALNTILKQHQLASGQPTEIMNVPQLARLIELLTAAGKDPAAVVSRMVDKLEAENGKP